MWVTSNIFGPAGALGEEAIELRNWLICFGCASEEFRVVVINKLVYWMAAPTPPPPLVRLLHTNDLPSSSTG